MKRLFIHNILFRLLCPFFSGALVYVLILLINNNVEQLRESFLGQELYVSIGLAFLIQEYARFSLLLFDRLKLHSSLLWQILIQLLFSVIITTGIVSLVMSFYFKNFLGYSPNFRELVIFNSIFCFIAVVYMMLFFAHQFLYKTNTQKIEEEVEALRDVEINFDTFKKEINIELLFESLESLIVLMKHSPDVAETFIDHFSSVYRHTISNSSRELILVSNELEIVTDLVLLFKNLPYRKIEIKSDLNEDFYVVPCTLISIIEKIMRSSISSSHMNLLIEINTQDDDIVISYEHVDTLDGGLRTVDLSGLSEHYSYYSSRELEVKNLEGIRTIYLPKIMIDEGVYS